MSTYYRCEGGDKGLGGWDGVFRLGGSDGCWC